MADLTHPDNFLDYLSSFWTQVFQDDGAVRGIAAADAHQLAQLYQDFVESVAALSIQTITPFHRELTYPIVLRKTTFSEGPDTIRFGKGIEWGAQPSRTAFREGVTFVYGGMEKRSGLYYVGIPAGVQNIQGGIFNRLINPSVFLVRDNDFILKDGILSFKQDPFTNPLIAKRTVAGPNGSIDEEVVLWASDTQFDHSTLFNHYGFLFPTIQGQGESYRRALECLLKAWSGGPTFAALDSLAAALAGAPLVGETSETVESIQFFNGLQLIITNTNIYTIPAGLTMRPEIRKGTVISAGQPLTTATVLADRKAGQPWWNELPALMAGPDLVAADITSLGFLNEPCRVEYKRGARFFLAGASRDVEAFWDQVRQKEADSNLSLADQLWRDAGLIDDSGAPDFSQSLWLNPLQFLAEKVLADDLLVLKLKVACLPNPSNLFRNLELLRRIAPAHATLLVFLSVETSEGFNLVRNDSGAINPTGTAPVNTQDLLDQAVGNFPLLTRQHWSAQDELGLKTKTPEALSIDDCPDIIRETLNLSSADLIQESLTIRTQELCEP